MARLVQIEQSVYIEWPLLIFIVSNPLSSGNRIWFDQMLLFCLCVFVFLSLQMLAASQLRPREWNSNWKHFKRTHLKRHNERAKARERRPMKPKHTLASIEMALLSNLSLSLFGAGNHLHKKSISSFLGLPSLRMVANLHWRCLSMTWTTTVHALLYNCYCFI